jgi:hypothetical protein
MAEIVYNAVRNFFKPYTFVHFRTVDRQAQDAPTFGIGGRESIREGFGLADRHRAGMYDWMGDETPNEALCQRGDGVISKGLSDPFNAFQAL